MIARNTHSRMRGRVLRQRTAELRHPTRFVPINS